MNELLKLLKLVKKNGFVTPEQKAKISELVAKASSEDQEVLADEISSAQALPEKSEEDEEVARSIKTLFESAKEQVRAELSAELKTLIDEHKENAKKKAGIYAPEVQAGRKEMSARIRELTKALISNDVAKMKEMTTDETGTPYAGYTVDTELSAEIRHLITQYGVARREMTSIALMKHDYKANNLVTDVIVYWVDEAAAIASSQVVLGQEDLSLKKLGAIVTFTNELLEDTEIDFMSFIAGRVAEGIARKEDEAFFKGDGSSTYGSFTGLLEATDVPDVTIAGTTFASLDADDLLDMVDELPTGALANAKFFYNRTIKSIIRKLKDNTNSYIYQAPSVSGPATVWGYPEVLVEAMPKASDTAANTAFVLFGDLRKACIHGYKASGLNMSVFDAGIVRNVAANADINLITTDRQAVRWTERTGYMRILPTAVVRLKTAETSA